MALGLNGKRVGHVVVDSSTRIAYATIPNLLVEATLVRVLLNCLSPAKPRSVWMEVAGVHGPTTPRAAMENEHVLDLV